MAEFGSALIKRVERLREISVDAERQIAAAMRVATIAAVETATENTPPNGAAALAGTNTRTGQMAQHWALDSKTTPEKTVGGMATELRNNMQYASYVNDGHRMDKHYVPGLIPNGGLLEMFPPEFGGIVVGTRTTWVPPLDITVKAGKTWRKVMNAEIKKRIEEIMR